MKACWNCHQSIELTASTCAHCKAAVPVTADPGPTPAARAAPPVQMPVRARARFVLAGPAQPPPAAGLASPDGEVPERSLRRALAENRRAALALCGLMLAIFTAFWYSGSTEPLGSSNCWSISEAKRKGLLDRTLVASPPEFEWDGRRISIEGAWVGQVAEARYASPFSSTIAYHPTGRRRVYFKTRYVKWPDAPQFWHGTPPRPCGIVEPTARVKRFVLHYIDVASSNPGPQRLLISDSARPDLGTVKMVLN